MAAPAKPAGPAPAAEELKRAMDYYYNGKGRGPILVEFKTCLKIDNNKESPTHYECVEPVSGPVKKGSLVHAWTLWFVPQGDKYDDVVIQFVFEGQIRSTQDIQLTDSFRSRTYRASPLSKAGKWEVKIVRGTTELASLPVTVE